MSVDSPSPCARCGAASRPTPGDDLCSDCAPFFAGPVVVCEGCGQPQHRPPSGICECYAILPDPATPADDCANFGDGRDETPVPEWDALAAEMRADPVLAEDRGIFKD